MGISDSNICIETKNLCRFAAEDAEKYRRAVNKPMSLYAAKIRSDMAYIERTYKLLTEKYGEADKIPPACEWLLDNMYMLKREYSAALGDLSGKHKQRFFDEYPVTALLCKGLIVSGRGKVYFERCREYLEGFESKIVLRHGELYSLPAVLRLELVSAAADICRKMQFEADKPLFSELFEAVFSSLRLLSVSDMSKILREADFTDRALRQDPTGEYSRMDRQTADEYLKRVEKLSAKEGIESYRYAQALIEKAQADKRHVGFYLFPKKKDYSGLYIGANLIFTLFISLYIGFITGSTAAVLLLIIPVSEITKGLIDILLLKLVSPRRLFRMNAEDGIPAEGRTIVVISSLLAGEKDGAKFAAELESCYFASRNESGALSFGLLADLPAADEAEMEQDRAIIVAAKTEINRLNRKYGTKFYLFTRPRHFDGEKYTGRERKRGAITELAKFISGKKSEIQCSGDADLLSGTRYILTLDSDTRITPGSIGELISVALHPLNRPVTDEISKTVVSGYGIYHPRIVTELCSASATDFAIVFGGSGGCDPYGAVCGELYMDCFSSGGFAGKGLIDINALLLCADERIPEGEVLSHDALEGAYLRGAYVSDVEFADTFPGNALSFYKRLHRWVRGDWQNSPWIFSRGKELREIDKFRLFDSLRRSMVSPFMLAAILAGFIIPGTGTAAAALAALIALMRDLIIAAIEDCRRPYEKTHLMRTAKLLTGFGGAIVRCFFRLWLLPYEAYICLSAALTALWRMFVTHSKLLQWQTAAQSSDSRHDFAGHIKEFLPAMIIGLITICVSPLIIGKASGLMWLLSPAAACALALPAYKDSPLSASDREYIRKAAADSWKYLCEFSKAEDNYLPPDNYQEHPPVGVAHRTSPTNIGFAMTAALAAADMEIIDRNFCIDYVNRIMNTIEKMPLAFGHLFNWYDTRTLVPLSPVFISTVDSGNLCASLYTVGTAMLEFGAEELADRMHRFANAMDFSPLYDKDRQLFYICYDVKEKRGAGGWYDLMASEARLTSYTAIAKGDIPKKHWSRLSRAQLRCDNYCGLASWTGTMFEYLMPEMFLPLFRASLLYESSRFCLYAQKHAVFAGLPWGISESAYYSFDGAMNYRYKAFGAAALSLKRGQENDTVISPYSSFLALNIAPRSAAANLQRIQNVGGRGKFGFFDAVDYTPSRSRNENGEKVRCYMAHHTGMSVISAANALCSGCIIKRFMSVPEMRAYELLLQERIPDNPIVIKRSSGEVPERAERLRSTKWEQMCSDNKCWSVLSNGIYSLRLKSDGSCRAFYGDTEVYRDAAPDMIVQSCEFYEDKAVFNGVYDTVSISDTVYVKASLPGEVHEIRLRSDIDADFAFTMRLTPVLCRESDYNAHPDFRTLGIEREYDGSSLIMRRINRSSSDLFFQIHCSENAEFKRDCFIIPLRLRAGEEYCLTVDYTLSFDKSALNGESCGRGNMVSAAASLLGMNESEIGFSMELLGFILRNNSYSASAKRELWKYGVSGDLPLLLCAGDRKELTHIIRAHIFLRCCGVLCDTVISSKEMGEYESPLRKAVSGLLSHYSLESLLNSDGGIHLLPDDAESVIRSRAVYTVGEEKALPLPLSFPKTGKRCEGCLPEYAHVGNEFRFTLKALPEKPWSHVLTNGRFSCILSESGFASMFYKNAREMQITRYHRAAELNKTEKIFIERDSKTVSLFADNDGHSCRVSYFAGAAVWEKQIFGRNVRMTVFIAEEDARVIIIEGGQGLELNWILPLRLGGDEMCVSSQIDDGVFSAVSSESYFTDLHFYAAASGKYSIEKHLGGMHLKTTLDSTSLLVCGVNKLSLIELCKLNNAKDSFRAAKSYWSRICDVFRLQSGVDVLDNYMHPWAIYQIISSRLYARAGIWQPGGAFGFRDQLQDAENLLLVFPEILKERIRDCCRHQYNEGDVMHWWHPHPDGDRGLRSRCSDDLLWLVRALCVYVESVGDTSFCFEKERFITSAALSDNEKDRYETSIYSDDAYIFDHARRAVDCCIGRGFGGHGLPFIGSCDWNDGFDEVYGESVWLGWFLADTLKRFASLIDTLGLPGSSEYYALSETLKNACESTWNGAWYNRAYYRDGVAIGGLDRIDSLAQSWAAFCGTDRERTDKALSECMRRLVDEQHRIVKIFSPPFSANERSPGYISTYGEGYRENGGQYTHAAIWLASALIKTGRIEEGWHILKMLLPETHDINSYLAEPFVLAADVYSAAGHEGEAGWTWYTGSAGWYFRVITEDILGIRMRGGRLEVIPALPEEIKEYTVHLNYMGQLLRIKGNSDGASIETLC